MKLNSSITGAITELICFKLASREALKAVADMGAVAQLVESLPLGNFISYNRLNDETRTGRLFGVQPITSPLKFRSPPSTR